MDPATIIVTSLVVGAAAGLKPTAEQFVKDAYNGLKSLVSRRLGSPACVTLLESEPESRVKRDLVQEELNKQDLDKDRELLAQSKALLDLISRHAPEAVATVGVDLRDIQGASLVLEDILSSGAGVRIDGAKVSGDIRITSVRAGQPDHLPDSSGMTDREPAVSSAHLDRVHAGHDFNYTAVQNVLVLRGPHTYQDFLNGLFDSGDVVEQTTTDVETLRKRLLRLACLRQPIEVKVTGTLFPAALLAAGWWERCQQVMPHHVDWRDDLQKWLFYGFDLWAPSWDFTWETLGDGRISHVIAQLGSGDEADSIPVFIPNEKATGLRAFLKDGWGGIEAEVTGFLGHRRHFVARHAGVEMVGGMLDYCLWIEDDRDEHGIAALHRRTEVYSGYLWKCVIPKAWLEQKPIPELRDVYFVWEHTNFRDRDAVNYNIDSLLHKERYIESLHGPLVLLQKSSSIVPGVEHWSTSQFRDALVHQKRKII